MRTVVGAFVFFLFFLGLPAGNTTSREKHDVQESISRLSRTNRAQASDQEYFTNENPFDTSGEGLCRD